MKLIAQYRVVNLKVQVKDVHHTSSQWAHTPNFTSLYLFPKSRGKRYVVEAPLAGHEPAWLKFLLHRVSHVVSGALGETRQAPMTHCSPLAARDARLHIPTVSPRQVGGRWALITI